MIHDRDISVPTWQECFAAGMYSLEAARARGMSHNSARNWAQRNGLKWPDGRSVPHGNRASTSCPCSGRGKDYPSVKAAAAAMGVKPNTISTHLAKHGHLDFVGTGRGGPRRWSKHRSKPVDVFGQHFESKKALADNIGVSVGTVIGWLNGSVRSGPERLLAAFIRRDAAACKEAMKRAEMVDSVVGRGNNSKVVALAQARRDGLRPEVERLRGEGKTIANIAREIGVNDMLVRRILSEGK